MKFQCPQHAARGDQRRVPVAARHHPHAPLTGQRHAANGQLGDRQITSPIRRLRVGIFTQFVNFDEVLTNCRQIQLGIAEFAIQLFNILIGAGTI